MAPMCTVCPCLVLAKLTSISSTCLLQLKHYLCTVLCYLSHSDSPQVIPSITLVYLYVYPFQLRNELRSAIRALFNQCTTLPKSACVCHVVVDNPRPHPLISIPTSAWAPNDSLHEERPLSVASPCLDSQLISHSAHHDTSSTAFHFFFFERIDESYFKAPPTTCKTRLTTSESAWAFFIYAAMPAMNIQMSTIFLSL